MAMDNPSQKTEHEAAAEAAFERRRAEKAERDAALTEKRIREWLPKVRHGISEAVFEMHRLAVCVEQNPGLMVKIARDTDRALALSSSLGQRPDDHGYPAFRRSLQIAKEISDPTARISLTFQAHYSLQKALHDAFGLDDSKWPSRREYIADQVERLGDEEAANETSTAENETPKTTTKRTQEGS